MTIQEESGVACPLFSSRPATVHGLVHLVDVFSRPLAMSCSVQHFTPPAKVTGTSMSVTCDALSSTRARDQATWSFTLTADELVTVQDVRRLRMPIAPSFDNLVDPSTVDAADEQQIRPGAGAKEAAATAPPRLHRHFNNVVALSASLDRVSLALSKAAEYCQAVMAEVGGARNAAAIASPGPSPPGLSAPMHVCRSCLDEVRWQLDAFLLHRAASGGHCDGHPDVHYELEALCRQEVYGVLRYNRVTFRARCRRADTRRMVFEAVAPGALDALMRCVINAAVKGCPVPMHSRLRDVLVAVFAAKSSVPCVQVDRVNDEVTATLRRGGGGTFSSCRDVLVEEWREGVKQLSTLVGLTSTDHDDHIAQQLLMPPLATDMGGGSPIGPGPVAALVALGLDGIARSLVSPWRLRSPPPLDVILRQSGGAKSSQLTYHLSASYRLLLPGWITPPAPPPAIKAASQFVSLEEEVTDRQRCIISRDLPAPSSAAPQAAPLPSFGVRGAVLFADYQRPTADGGKAAAVLPKRMDVCLELRRQRYARLIVPFASWDSVVDAKHPLDLTAFAQLCLSTAMRREIPGPMLAAFVLAAQTSLKPKRLGVAEASSDSDAPTGVGGRRVSDLAAASSAAAVVLRVPGLPEALSAATGIQLFAAATSTAAPSNGETSGPTAGVAGVHPTPEMLAVSVLRAVLDVMCERSPRVTVQGEPSSPSPSSDAAATPPPSHSSEEATVPHRPRPQAEAAADRADTQADAAPEQQHRATIVFLPSGRRPLGSGEGSALSNDAQLEAWLQQMAAVRRERLVTAVSPSPLLATEAALHLAIAEAASCLGATDVAAPWGRNEDGPRVSLPMAIRFLVHHRAVPFLPKLFRNAPLTVRGWLRFATGGFGGFSWRRTPTLDGGGSVPSAFGGAGAVTAAS